MILFWKAEIQPAQKVRCYNEMAKEFYWRAILEHANIDL